MKIKMILGNYTGQETKSFELENVIDLEKAKLIGINTFVPCHILDAWIISEAETDFDVELIGYEDIELMLELIEDYENENLISALIKETSIGEAYNILEKDDFTSIQTNLNSFGNFYYKVGTIYLEDYTTFNIDNVPNIVLENIDVKGVGESLGKRGWAFYPENGVAFCLN